MASIFKRGRKYYIKFKDEHGKWKMVAGYTDKQATETKLRELERETECRIRGLVDPYERPRQVELAEHIEAFRRHLESENNTGEYIDRTISRLQAIFVGCGFTRINDLTAYDANDRVIKYLRDRRGLKPKASKKEKGENRLSAASSNHYLTAIKNFCNWASKAGRMPPSSIANVKKTTTEENSRPRRAASEVEIAKIIKAAGKGGEVYGLTGEQRVYLYLTATNTGLRAQELASLRPFDFRFRARPPHILVRESVAKNGVETEQPLQPAFARKLAKWLCTHCRPDEKIWPGNWYQRAAEMLEVDLKAAGIPVKTADGILDFHALRATFITSLVRGGVHPKIVQTLARHSQIELTMKLYTKLTASEVAPALDVLPEIAPNLHQTRVRSGHSESETDRSKNEKKKPQTANRKRFTA